MSASGKNVKAKTQPLSPSGESLLGVNLWRMRLADTSAPVKVRGLIHKQDPNGIRDWTPERVTLDQPIPEGENLRLTIESARSGYLYVIDRDIYEDGTKSASTLIFPTKRLHGGVNLVQPGRPVEIPDFNDQPPTFELVRTRPDQNALMLTFILAPRPLTEITVQPEAYKLTEEQTAKWEKQWGTEVGLAEDKSTSGKLYTLAEKTAASDTSKPLSDKDPVPLILFYRTGHPGQPMLATALIKVAPAK